MIDEREERQESALLLDGREWSGRIYSDDWVDAPATVETTEPATGKVLGIAGVGDVAVDRPRECFSAEGSGGVGSLLADRANRGDQTRRRAARAPPGGARAVADPRVGVGSRQSRSGGDRLDRTARSGRGADFAPARPRTAVADPGAQQHRPAGPGRDDRRDHSVEFPDRAGDALDSARRSCSATRSC